MNLILKSRGFTVSEPLRQYVERRAGFALDRCQPSIGRVVVDLEDLNGPKGGVDKACRISAEVTGIRTVCVQERGTHFAAAVDQACRRLSYRLHQLLRRGRPEEAARLHQRERLRAGTKGDAA